MVCVNVVTWPVGKQNDIAYEIYETVWQTYKIEVVAATFMKMNRDENDCSRQHDQTFAISSS